MSRLPGFWPPRGSTPDGDDAPPRSSAPTRTALLCLHERGAHGHPTLTDPSRGRPDHGLILFLRVRDVPEALERVRDLVPRSEEEPHLDPHTGTWEFSVRDPEGYFVTIGALPADETQAS